MTDSSKKRAWLDLAEQTTQAVDHEADEVHSLTEQPLKRVSFQGPWDDGKFVETGGILRSPK